MGDSRPDVFKASALQHPLYHVATVRTVVDRLGIDIPKQPPRKTLDKFAHRKNVIINAAPIMGETVKVYQKLSTPRTAFSPHFMPRVSRFQSPIGNWQHWNWQHSPIGNTSAPPSRAAASASPPIVWFSQVP